MTKKGKRSFKIIQQSDVGEINTKTTIIIPEGCFVLVWLLAVISISIAIWIQIKYKKKVVWCKLIYDSLPFAESRRYFWEKACSSMWWFSDAAARYSIIHCIISWSCLTWTSLNKREKKQNKIHINSMHFSPSEISGKQFVFTSFN